MNRDYRYSAGSAIADFLWELANGRLGPNGAQLKVVGDRNVNPSFLWDDSVTINPIYLAVQENAPSVPVEEPRIVYYPYSGPSKGTLYGLKKARVLFSVTGAPDRTYPIVDWMIDVLNRFDDSATLVNKYTSSSRPDITFRSIRADQTNISEDNLADYAFDGTAADTSFSQLNLTITCDYVVNNDYLREPYPAAAFAKVPGQRSVEEQATVDRWNRSNGSSLL
jgi:hypothetical protein